ncbi:MAG: Rne/Rng family ribonuclease [Phycisphaerae bacterium]|nr:Rne/Rng family ribonuclease [Phycisphaerae bacterium]
MEPGAFEPADDVPDWVEEGTFEPESASGEDRGWHDHHEEEEGSAPRSEQATPSTEDEAAGRRRRRRRGGRRRRGRGDEAVGEEQAPRRVPASPVAGRTTEATDDEESEDFDDFEPGASTDVDEDIPIASEPAGAGERELLINIAESEECRIAVLHRGRLEEIFIERQSAQSHVGNVYKAKVTNVEPSIQAAFVDFGLPKNGFLHISDVHKKYFPGSDKSNEDVGRKIAKRDRPLIQRCLRRGQEIMVQVIKEGVGTKGPTVTTYLSIPGRFLVMMPGMGKLGVSRKIEDEDLRRQMRHVLGELTLPEGVGFILRTAGMGQTKRELQRDLNYLTRLWKKLCEREEKLPAPAELYREQDLVIRTMRDVYSSDFKRVVVDDAETARRIRDFLRIAMPRAQQRIELYADKEPMFHRFGIERELALLNSRRVPLPSGGSIVIDTGEAMTTIDVNSGKFRRPDNAEETALAINLEAAEEITRQLRLRDIGGIIVCDFIDMVQLSNRRKVVNAMREGLRKHKERARVLNMSPFGLVEITRQRQRHSYARSLYSHCPVCDSTGWVKTPESVALDVIRILRYLVAQPQVHRIRCHVAAGVALAVLNRKRAELSRLEGDTGKSIEIFAEDGLFGEQMRVECEDVRGVALNLPSLPDAPSVRADNERRNGSGRHQTERESAAPVEAAPESASGESSGREGRPRRRRRGGRGRNRNRD